MEGDAERPLVTFALLCFNQEKFVTKAIRSAFAQTYSPLEILVSDDLSDDRTWEIIRREVAAYSGPHRVRIHRNSSNLSCTVHTLSALAMASGDLVVIGAGDDISEPDRVAVIAETAHARPRTLSFWSDVLLIDENGKDIGVAPGYGLASSTAAMLAAHGAAPGGASQAYRKIVGTFFGDVDPRAASEDLVLHFRAALLGEVAKAPGVLVRWRRHVGSMESINALTEDVDADSFRRKFLAINRQRLFCYRVRIGDLAELERKCPQRSAEIQSYVLSTRRIVKRFEIAQSLADGHLIELPMAIAKALCNGFSARETIKQVMTVRFPALWQRYARYRAGKLSGQT